MLKKLFVALGFSLCALPAHATIISVSGDVSNHGVSASIIAAPADANDDAASNLAQQGFDEQQNVLLTSNLSVDGGSIAAGTTVDSHMIFLNTGPGNNTTLAEHFNVEWIFSGTILGVMSSSNGSLEVASSSLLGAAGTNYPGSTFNARGLEGNQNTCNMDVNDCYQVNGNQLLLTMRVTEPGDWIRVITASSVPEPTSALLLGLGLIGIGLRRKNII